MVTLLLRRVLVSLLLHLAACTAFALPATQPAADPLQHLRAQHPRLLVLDDQLAAVTSAIKTDSLAQAMHDRLLHEANRLLTIPAETYTIGGSEHTLLATSRTIEGRVMLLAGLYRLDHDRRFADRAVAEMRAAAGFPDWFPKHFLDTAEMTAALGIGYDWCFDAMSIDDRNVIRQAIVDKGLDPGIARMAPKEAFSKMHNNWVQVCYGGLTLGTLAVAEDEPARAREVIAESIPAMQQIMKLFSPDGGFEEGPVYWDYATTFNCYYLAGLETALGTDFGLAKLPGFSQTGEYRMQTISPLGMYANFGDCGPTVDDAPQMFWMARQFDQPMYAEHERNLDMHLDLKRHTPGILELLWQFPLIKTGNTPLPLAASFARIDAAFMRTSWTDPMATYVAFKGGDAHASHGHLDLGQIICEMAGQRWAVDLGADSYGLPSYFGALRFSYYRLQTQSHNTLTIGDANESTSARAPMTLLHPADQSSAAIIDLSACYPKAFKSWVRGVLVQGPDRIVIQDEIDPSGRAHVLWHFHTRALVKAAGDSGQLSQADAVVQLHILSPQGAKFSVIDASKPPAPNGPNLGVSDVQIDLGSTQAPTTIAVELTHGDLAGQPFKLMPLHDWANATK